MNLEKFIRQHLANGHSRLVLDVALDKHTNKVTALFEDTDQDGQRAHVRIEGDKTVFQSWDEDGEGKPEAPHVSEAKQAAAKEAEAKKKAKK